MVSLLDVGGLTVAAPGRAPLLDGVGFRLVPGERVGLIGPSGSGKSLTAAALGGLLRPPLRASGSARLDGLDLLALSPRGWRGVRGIGVFEVFQSPGAALTPGRRVGPQLAEAARRAGRPNAAVADALAAVELSPTVVRRWPHQLSGGMKQRVLIAMALILRPRLLIADEPTTGLDALTEREVLGALDAMIAATGAALLFISHDLRAVATVAPRTLVIDAGRIVADGPTAGLATAEHAAARRLAGAAAALGAPC